LDPIQPIGRSDRTVQPVELTPLRALEREREREEERRERARKRRAANPSRPGNGAIEPNTGIDVRV
jgi:hypothetical protein